MMQGEVAARKEVWSQWESVEEAEEQQRRKRAVRDLERRRTEDRSGFQEQAAFQYRVYSQKVDEAIDDRDRRLQALLERGTQRRARETQRRYEPRTGNVMGPAPTYPYPPSPQQSPPQYSNGAYAPPPPPAAYPPMTPAAAPQPQPYDGPYAAYAAPPPPPQQPQPKPMDAAQAIMLDRLRRTQELADRVMEERREKELFRGRPPRPQTPDDPWSRPRDVGAAAPPPPPAPSPPSTSDAEDEDEDFLTPRRSSRRRAASAPPPRMNPDATTYSSPPPPQPPPYMQGYDYGYGDPYYPPPPPPPPQAQLRRSSQRVAKSVFPALKNAIGSAETAFNRFFGALRTEDDQWSAEVRYTPEGMAPSQPVPEFGRPFEQRDAGVYYADAGGRPMAPPSPQESQAYQQPPPVASQMPYPPAPQAFRQPPPAALPMDPHAQGAWGGTAARGNARDLPSLAMAAPAPSDRSVQRQERRRTREQLLKMLRKAQWEGRISPLVVRMAKEGQLTEEELAKELAAAEAAGVRPPVQMKPRASARTHPGPAQPQGYRDSMQRWQQSPMPVQDGWGGGPGGGAGGLNF